MGGFFGITAKTECLSDVYFGVDYHSHLGTHRAGLAAWDPERGLQREIHSIEHAPFRTKFETALREMNGQAAIGCISDADPQPLIVRGRTGIFAVSLTGVITNADKLIGERLRRGAHFDVMTGGRVNGTELLAVLINEREDLAEGIRYAQEVIEGTASILILTDKGELVAARDRFGRLPVQLGKAPGAFAVSFESFALEKLGFEPYRELGPGEIVRLSPEGEEVLLPPLPKKRICAFLWSYYGYPSSGYEGVSVEAMRYRNGASMARSEKDLPDERHHANLNRNSAIVSLSISLILS